MSVVKASSGRQLKREAYVLLRRLYEHITDQKKRNRTRSVQA